MSGISSIGGLSQGVTRSFAPPSFSTIDTNSDGGISLEELASNAPGGVTDARSEDRAAKLFEQMDADGDGTVTSEEKDAFDAEMADRMSGMQFSAQLMASVGGPDGAGGPGRPDLEAAADDIVSALDGDSDGSVSLSEFSSSDVVEGYSSDEIEALFSAIDADSSGTVSSDEISSFLEDNKPEGPPPMGAGGPPPPPPGSGMEESESASALSETYDALDTNQDGVVSLEERLAAAFGSGSEAESTTSAFGMLSAALSAYSSSSSSTTSSDSLLSSLFSTLDSEV